MKKLRKVWKSLKKRLPELLKNIATDLLAEE